MLEQRTAQRSVSRERRERDSGPNRGGNQEGWLEPACCDQSWEQIIVLAPRRHMPCTSGYGTSYLETMVAVSMRNMQPLSLLQVRGKGKKGCSCSDPGASFSMLREGKGKRAGYVVPGR